MLTFLWHVPYAYTRAQTFAPIISGQVLYVLSTVHMFKLYICMSATIHMCNISDRQRMY